LNFTSNIFDGKCNCSRRRFGEYQAENWWSENKDKVYEKYNVRSVDKSSSQGAHKAEGAGSPASQT